MDHLTPKQIVSELDRYIVGQDAAKKAVAIAEKDGRLLDELPEGRRLIQKK